jgi:hypothetical protein
MAAASADVDMIRASAAKVRKAEHRFMVVNLWLMWEEVMTAFRDMAGISRLCVGPTTDRMIYEVRGVK